MSVESMLEDIRQANPELDVVLLVYLPEKIILGFSGGGSEMDNEPLARACHRCFSGDAERVQVLYDADPVALGEYLMVGANEVFIFERGRREPRIALAASSRAELNVSLLLSSARRA